MQETLTGMNFQAGESKTDNERERKRETQKQRGRESETRGAQGRESKTFLCLSPLESGEKTEISLVLPSKVFTSLSALVHVELLRFSALLFPCLSLLFFP